MKSILLIGMGRFGHHLCENLVRHGNEVMVVDQSEAQVQDLLQVATSVRIGDCTKEEVLRALGVRNFDMCIVCIGTNFQSSLEITNLLKELGAKYVVSKASRSIQAKFLEKVGADEVVFPDRDVAEKLSVRYSENHIFDYFQLSNDYSVYEVPPLPSWIGKSIAQSNVRFHHHVNIVGVKREGNFKMVPTADYVFDKDDHLLILGTKENVQKLMKHY